MAKFKEYNQGQMLLLPPSLDEKIAENHICRIINNIVDELNISEIEKSFSPKGCRAYHPKMLLKVLIYSYSVGVRSSRKIAQRIKEDVVFMWLSAQQEPDFRTINDFRKNKLGNIKKIFDQVLSSCMELGLINCGKISLDGTKIEANSSRHKMNYRKSLEKRLSNYEDQINQILKEAEEADKMEDELYGDYDGYSLDRPYSKEEIKKALDKVKRKKETLERQKEKIEIKKEDVENKLGTMGNERNSYGTTDKDATRMMMKEGYTSPGYNLQMASENQIIVAYKLSQRCNDSHELQPMMKEIENNFKKLPKYLTTDKGYGTFENYQYLEKIKYENAAVPNQYYDRDKIALKNGKYELSKNIEYEKLKLKMIKFLNSEKGQKLLKKRRYDIEPVFGNIKYNMGFRKFLLRGLEYVNIEVGLIALAHNLKKIREFNDSLSVSIANSTSIEKFKIYFQNIYLFFQILFGFSIFKRNFLFS